MWEMAAVILHDDVLLERTVLETLLEMDRCYYRASVKDRGAISLVLDLAKALKRFRRLVVWHGRRVSTFCQNIFDVRHAPTPSTRGGFSVKGA